MHIRRVLVMRAYNDNQSLDLEYRSPNVIYLDL